MQACREVLDEPEQNDGRCGSSPRMRARQRPDQNGEHIEERGGCTTQTHAMLDHHSSISLDFSLHTRVTTYEYTSSYDDISFLLFLKFDSFSLNSHVPMSHACINTEVLYPPGTDVHVTTGYMSSYYNTARNHSRYEQSVMMCCLFHAMSLRP